MTQIYRKRVIYGPFSCCWDIPKWTVRSGILALSLKMLWKSQKSLKFNKLGPLLLAPQSCCSQSVLALHRGVASRASILIIQQLRRRLGNSNWTRMDNVPFRRNFKRYPVMAN